MQPSGWVLQSIVHRYCSQGIQPYSAANKAQNKNGKYHGRSEGQTVIQSGNKSDKGEEDEAEDFFELRKTKELW